MKPVVFALLVAAACGGPSSAGDQPRPALVAAEPAAPVSPAVAEPSFCDALCDRVLTCMADIAGREPDADERRAFEQRCPARCEAQSPASLDAAQACLEERDDSCPELVTCLKPIE